MAPRREDLGSWLEGTPGGGRPDGLGLPASGRGSLAPLGRRVAALLVDWLLASLVAYGFLGEHPMLPLAVFGVSTAVLVSTLGFTVGHRVLGLQVVRLVDLRVPVANVSRGRATPEAGTAWPPPGFVLGATRTLLVCLVIPAVVWDATGRGMHDVACGTAVVRR